MNDSSAQWIRTGQETHVKSARRDLALPKSSLSLLVVSANHRSGSAASLRLASADQGAPRDLTPGCLSVQVRLRLVDPADPSSAWMVSQGADASRGRSRGIYTRYGALRARTAVSRGTLVTADRAVLAVGSARASTIVEVDYVWVVFGVCPRPESTAMKHGPGPITGEFNDSRGYASR